MDRNRNTRMVIVKADRHCCHCGERIPKGTKCLTLNPKGAGRKWLCNECLSVIQEREELKLQEMMLPFGDEGGAYCLQELITENEYEWLERGYMKNQK